MANTPPIQPHQSAPTEPRLRIEHPGYGCIDPFRAAFSDPRAQQALDDIEQVQRAIDDGLSDTEMLRLLRGDDEAIAPVRWLREALEQICDDEHLMPQERPIAEAHRRTMTTAVEELQRIEATAATRVTQSVSDQLAAHSTQSNLHLSLLQAAARFKKNTPP